MDFEELIIKKLEEIRLKLEPGSRIWKNRHSIENPEWAHLCSQKYVLNAILTEGKCVNESF